MRLHNDPRRYSKTSGRIQQRQFGSIADFVFGDLFQNLERVLVVTVLVLIMFWAIYN